MIFNENGKMPNEIYKNILFDKLEFNEGMIIENIVAQMLRANNKELYFFSKNSEVKENRMGIDFLITNKNVTKKHNICPIEVKTGKNYTCNSLIKFKNKYKEQIGTLYIIHTKDYKENDGIVYLPIYMTPFL